LCQQLIDAQSIVSRQLVQWNIGPIKPGANDRTRRKIPVVAFVPVLAFCPDIRKSIQYLDRRIVSFSVPAVLTQPALARRWPDRTTHELQ
jgi:hypothetical protein